MGAQQSKSYPSKFHPNECTTNKKVIGNYYCLEYKRRYEKEPCDYKNFKMDCKMVSPCSYDKDDHNEVRFYRTICAFRTKHPYRVPDCLIRDTWQEYKKLCFCKIDTFVPSRKKLNCICYNGFENIDDRLVLLESYTKVCTCPRILYIGCVNRKYLKSDEQSTYSEKFNYVCDGEFEGYPIAFNSDLFCANDDMPKLLPHKQDSYTYKNDSYHTYGNDSNIYSLDTYNNTMNVTDMENNTTTEVTTSIANTTTHLQNFTLTVNKTMNYTDDNLLIYKSFFSDDTPISKKTFDINFIYSIPGIILFIAFLYITTRFMRKKNNPRTHKNTKIYYSANKNNDEENLIDVSSILDNTRIEELNDGGSKNPAFVE